MTVQVKDATILTEEEVVTIGRFQEILRDRGVQGALMMRFMDDNRSVGVAAKEVFGAYVTDVLTTNAPDIHKAGVSLDELCWVARSGSVVPADLVPSEDTVKKCVTKFWDSFRSKS